MSSLTFLTGGTKGLGLEFLRQLLGRRERVHLIGRRLSTLAEKENFPGSLLALLECDLADVAAPTTANLATDITASIGGLTFSRLVFINNAGTVEPIGLVGQSAEVELARSVAINFVAPMVIANVLRRVAQDRGVKLKVFNISSGAALKPIPGWGAYCGSKAGARMFFDVLLSEGVDVRHIDPGVMNTDMQTTIRAASPDHFPPVDRFRTLAAEGRLLAPDAVAARILAEHFE